MHNDPEQQQSPVARSGQELTQDMVRHLLDQGLLERQQMVRRLRSLPHERAQPYDWAEFRRRALAHADRDTRRGLNRRAYLVAAAALVLVVLGLATWMRLIRAEVKPLVASHEPEETHEPVLAGRADPDYSASVDRRTDAAERWLVDFPSESGVVRVGTRAVVTGLEDRIAQLDDFLSAARVEGAQPAALAGAEEQRALLVKSLAQVRYAETLVAAAR